MKPVGYECIASVLSVKAARSVIRYRTTIYRKLSHRHLHRSNTDMEDIRGSLSKVKKKFKHRLAGRKPKPDGTGVNLGEEGADPTSSLPQPEPHVITGASDDREGDRASVAGQQVSSTDEPPQPAESESVPARRTDNGQEREEADVDGGEASQSNSHPQSDIEVAVGSERSGALEGVSPSPSTPLISHGGNPDGM